jgi:acyl-CoA synthetase (AMP-forming)/AMP-acid ligase II
VVPGQGAQLDQAAVITFCRANLAHYKCPTIVEFVDALPRNASGKLLKHALRAGPLVSTDT